MDHRLVAVGDLLTRHGLPALRETVVLAASELVATAHRFISDREMLLWVHWQFDPPRIALYDQHPSHGSAVKSEKSRERRGDSM
ncbi:hypothetical protein [Streptomyces sp. NPDC001880]